MQKIPWTSETQYYDVANGEQITKHKAQRDYYIIKTDKVPELNANKTRGHMKYIKTCAIKPQLKLEL